MLNQKGNAQITLQFEFDSTTINTFYCTDIGNNEFKYVFEDTKTNSFSLYNMDMSSFITDIHIPSSDSIIKGWSVLYITRTLFDCDSSNIEYVYENAIDAHRFSIFRTDGIMLFQLDSANGPYSYGGVQGGAYDFRPIQNTSDGTKLFLQKLLGQDHFKLLIYSLCGKLK